MYKILCHGKSIENYLLIDPDVDGNGTEMVTNITVKTAIGGGGGGSNIK